MSCTALLKTMMFAFNCIVILAGAVLLGLGVWLRLDQGSLEELLGDQDVEAGLSSLASACYLLMGAGAVLLLTGCLGCCGTLTETRWMLGTFFVLLVIIFISEIALAVLLFAFNDQADELLEKVDDLIIEKFEERFAYGNVSDLWACIMQELKCCGYHGYQNFPRATVFPAECCLGLGVCGLPEAEHANIEGCRDKMVEAMKSTSGNLGGAVLVVAMFEVAAMAVSIILYKDIGHKSTILHK